LPTNKAEHDFKFASGLEYSADSSQHEQSQALIGVLAVLCTEETGQSVADAFCAIPFQTVQIVTDGVVLIAVSDNGDSFLDFLLARQCVFIFQIEHQIIQVRIVECRCLLAPPKGLYNVDTLRENVVPDSTLQIWVILKYCQTVPYAVLDSSAIGQVQTSSDFFHGHARLWVLQIAVQVSSPLFFARQPELSFLRECRTREYQADIRYSFLFAGLPRTGDAIHPPAVSVRTAVSMLGESGSNRSAPCSIGFLPVGISVRG